ncbi:MAG: sugar phosphate isomerase/epimerase [Candidatus Latescibacteria bacterium]|jgi:sugar phosphate isomerase/epimerase|nr:sugar phosphate isomerase/epimerase [Candidatus Latescibacterota bacterium]
MATEPKLGVQLYSVRDLTGDDDFKETLTALADLGYEGVEFAWKYGGMAPDELASFLDSIGLVCCGLHVQLDELLDPAHQVYDYALACGSPYITTSLCSRIDEWGQLIPQVDQAGRIANSKGLQFTYHNHHQEFARIGGRYAQDILRNETDSQAVQFEIDLGWVRKGGEEPISYWLTYSGRVPQIHLRDYDTEKDQVCDVGDGFIDLEEIASLAAESYTHWLIYEQDAYPDSSMASARACADRCRAAGLIA